MLAHIREHGGRVLVMSNTLVICLTTNGELKDWLLDRGARVNHEYRRARDAEDLEWDLTITGLRVEDDIVAAARA